MEAQLPAEPAGESSSAEAAPEPAPAPEPTKVGSDAKGWTIFVERPAGIRPPSEPSPAAAPEPAPAAAPEPSWAAPAAAPEPAKPAAESFEDVRVSSRTVAAEEAPPRAAQPVSNKTLIMQEAPVIAPPPSPTAHVAPIAPIAAPMATRPSDEIEAGPKSKTGLIIAVAVGVVVIIVAIVLSMT